MHVTCRLVGSALVLSEYDPEWPRRYEAERTRITAALGSLAERTEHIGSTAVPGLVAKPIIDILLGIARLELSTEEIAAMEALGYTYRGEFGIPRRRYFSKPGYHVHTFRVGEGQWTTHLLWRDYLRNDAGARVRYASFKRFAAVRSRWDRDRYQELKDEFVAGMLREAPRRDSPP
jgi:GrpB-like predicted nucleotidyltransferase (UPF0157 family)